MHLEKQSWMKIKHPQHHKAGYDERKAKGRGYCHGLSKFKHEPEKPYVLDEYIYNHRNRYPQADLCNGSKEADSAFNEKAIAEPESRGTYDIRERKRRISGIKPDF